MRSDSQGVQQLLIAEKRAEEKISIAKKRKVSRLKQAKEEAQAEVIKYRELKESQFKEFESSLGSQEASAAKIDSETNAKMNQMVTLVGASKSSVIDCLLNQVLHIKPEVHVNFVAKIL